MSDTNVDDPKRPEENLLNDDVVVVADAMNSLDDGNKKDLDDNTDGNPMPSSQQEDHELAYFDSADWALGNTEILERITKVLEIMVQLNQNNPNPRPIERHWLAEFMEVDPPKFEGGYNNPEGAQKWLQEIEKILKAMQIPAARWVPLATFMLVGEAENWWEHATRMLKAENREISWEVFKEKFLEKYFPEDIRYKKELEFLSLKQGAMSVGEYAAKFEELIKYSLYNHWGDERSKCIKFEMGLRTEIRVAFEYQGIRNFHQLVNMCSTYEEGLKAKEVEERSARATRNAFGLIRGKRPPYRPDPYPGLKTKASTPKEAKLGRPTPAAIIPECPQCGRFHRGACWTPDNQKKERLCFLCNQPGHFAAYCPNRASKEANAARVGRGEGSRPVQRGKIYAE